MSIITTTVSDEQIIAALLSNGTQKAAAAACGISERTLYDRLGNRDFKFMYRKAKADVLRQTVCRVNAEVLAAIDTIAGIMKDPDNNVAVRLQAAQTILNAAAKMAERLNGDEHDIEVDEHNSRFDFF